MGGMQVRKPKYHINSDHPTPSCQPSCNEMLARLRQLHRSNNTAVHNCGCALSNGFDVGGQGFGVLRMCLTFCADALEAYHAAQANEQKSHKACHARS